jgi:hypothetical protein
LLAADIEDQPVGVIRRFKILKKLQVRGAGLLPGREEWSGFFVGGHVLLLEISRNIKLKKIMEVYGPFMGKMQV